MGRNKFLIGPFFPDEKLTGTKYVNFLSTCLHEILQEVPVDIRLRMRFMHEELRRNLAEWLDNF